MRPRRGGWSLPWSRRCWVRSLIRSVSRAICTSAVPVSPSPLPKRATISCLRSAVTLMRRRRVARGVAPSSAGALADLPGGLDVAPDLLDQLANRAKQPLSSQALEEVDVEILAVEVALEVDEVGLDQ